MQNEEQQTTVEHDAPRAQESDEARTEPNPIGRLLANPRRTRRA